MYPPNSVEFIKLIKNNGEQYNMELSQGEYGVDLGGGRLKNLFQQIIK